MAGYGERKSSKGQSTVEYIILVAAVLVAILIFGSRSGIFQNALNATYDININIMLNMAERILQ